MTLENNIVSDEHSISDDIDIVMRCIDQACNNVALKDALAANSAIVRVKNNLRIKDQYDARCPMCHKYDCYCD